MFTFAPYQAELLYIILKLVPLSIYPCCYISSLSNFVWLVHAFSQNIITQIFQLILDFYYRITSVTHFTLCFLKVKIEEIVDDENPCNENGASKETKNRNSQKSKSISNRDSEKQIVKSTAGVLELESEDEDGFPIVSHGKRIDIYILYSCLTTEGNNDENTGDELDKSCDRNDRSHGKSLKRKAVADEDDESSR